VPSCFSSQMSIRTAKKILKNVKEGKCNYTEKQIKTATNLMTKTSK